MRAEIIRRDLYWSLFLSCRIASRMELSAANVVLYFLEPMLIEPGLGKSPDKCDRLALDEPDVLLTSPT